jgi:hypothetical protein
LYIYDAKYDKGYVILGMNKPRIYLSGGYDFNINPSRISILKPSFLARYVTASPLFVASSSTRQIQQNFEFGELYRTDKAYASVGNFILNQKLIIGYAYEVSTISTMVNAKNMNKNLL